MSTRAQRKAARRNAELSTGPRTPEGKAASARNATKHNLSGATFVLLPGENVRDFEALTRDYRDEWRPNTPHESFLVAQMIQARWRLNRIARMEAEVVDAMLSRFGENQSDEGAIVIADGINPNALGRLRRYAQDAERSYHRAVRELRAYRKDVTETKKRNEPKPEAAEATVPPNSFPISVHQRSSAAITPSEPSSLKDHNPCQSSEFFC